MTYLIIGSIWSALLFFAWTLMAAAKRGDEMAKKVSSHKS